MAKLIRTQHEATGMGVAGRLKRHRTAEGIIQLQRGHRIGEKWPQLIGWHRSIDVELVNPGWDGQHLETLRQQHALHACDLNELMNLLKEERVMNDQIVFEIGQQVVARIKLISQITLGLKTQPQGIGGRHSHMGQPAATGCIELIEHVMAAIGDQMQVNLMTMVEIGGIRRLIGEIEMQLMATKPGKGEDLLT